MSSRAPLGTPEVPQRRHPEPSVEAMATAPLGIGARVQANALTKNMAMFLLLDVIRQNDHAVNHSGAELRNIRQDSYAVNL